MVVQILSLPPIRLPLGSQRGTYLPGGVTKPSLYQRPQLFRFHHLTGEEEAMIRRYHLLVCGLGFVLASATRHATIPLGLAQDPGRASPQSAAAPAAEPAEDGEDRPHASQGPEIPPSRPGAISGATDSDLQAAVRKALRNEPTLAHDNLAVSVSANTIELSGSVANGREFQTAARIARSYAGSKWLVNHIEVRQPSPPRETASPEKPQPPR